MGKKWTDPFAFFFFCFFPGKKQKKKAQKKPKKANQKSKIKETHANGRAHFFPFFHPF